MGLLGEDTPEQLVNTLIYLLGINFALCGGEEHKQLKVGYAAQICLKYDSEVGKNYLKYNPTQCKNHQGGLKDRKRIQKLVTAYENPNPKYCIVHLFQKYMGLRPNNNPKYSKDFYL